MQVSFKASLIKTPNITKIKAPNSFISQKTSFVELDLKSNIDYELIRAAGLDWDNGYSFAADIFDSFANDKFSSKNKDSRRHRYFALFKNDKEKFDKKNLLGVATIYKKLDKTYRLLYLQVNPKETYNAKERQFKHIGQTIVNSIIDLLPIKKIDLYPVNKNAELFYESLNFKTIPNDVYMRYEG